MLSSKISFKISTLKGDQVGYGQLPGSNEVYNSITQKWDKQYNQVSSISGNWSLFVNKDSKNKELAFHFATHMADKELSKKSKLTL